MTHTLSLSDLKKLKEMIGGDIGDLAELVSDFVAELPAQLAQMRAQSAADDWAGLRITAHSCKSNARDLGASTLSEQCARLETQCARGEVQAIDAQLAEITKSADIALAEYEKLDLSDV